MNELLQNVPAAQMLAVAGIAFLAFFLLAWLLSFARGKAERFPYVTKPILTDAELNFHRALAPLVPAGTVLLGKVRLADFLEVTERGDQFLSFFGKIAQKHADFLLADEETFEPLLVIELDDSTHRRSSRTMQSDDFKDAAYAAAELPILRVRAAKSYDRKALAEQLREALGE